jgi:hypothetical protein
MVRRTSRAWNLQPSVESVDVLKAASKRKPRLQQKVKASEEARVGFRRKLRNTGLF